jgi:hypothetical protein
VVDSERADHSPLVVIADGAAGGGAAVLHFFATSFLLGLFFATNFPLQLFFATNFLLGLFFATNFPLQLFFATNLLLELFLATSLLSRGAAVEAAVEWGTEVVVEEEGDGVRGQDCVAKAVVLRA